MEIGISIEITIRDRISEIVGRILLVIVIVILIGIQMKTMLIEEKRRWSLVGKVGLRQGWRRRGRSDQ